MAPAIFAGRTKCNDLITIADFPAEADQGSILMVNGGLKAKLVELRRFGGQHPMDTGNRQVAIAAVHLCAKALARFRRARHWNPA
jgi:hypothetical protein